MEYITASCVIRNNRIYRDGEIVWERSPAGPADFLQSCYQHFGFQYPKFYKMDHLSKLGWLAAEFLLHEGFDPAQCRPEEMAVVLSNANSSLDTDYRYFASVSDIPSPALFVYTLPNIMIGEICIRNNFKGENAFFITESFDAAFIATYVRDLLGTGNARACICGWVEVLGDRYAAALFLIEHKDAGLSFTAENMIGMYNLNQPA
ncbi:MAG TPA: hypothetical protein VNV35_00975 [Puia sp.]|nr:hypothetical protein [Puia sp.]